eukprot:gb/GECH01014429.1/.p1 GENE.gb/GECH01014429.1/~~gb/GECH01014429.1/.p1  ORF type:complete len:410 (+),score=26.72 gb/GECH01014429.1/:1-1230(+)
MQNEKKNLERKANALVHCETRESVLSSIKEIFSQLSLSHIPEFNDFSPKDQEKMEYSLKNIRHSNNFSSVSTRLRLLSKILRKRVQASENTFVLCCLLASDATTNILDNILKATVKKYFELKGFTPHERSFSTKSSGEQIGCIVSVVNSAGQTSKYYCKTHHHGARKVNSSRGREPVDVAELMVYVLLNQLDVGPHVEFCCTDEYDFFILSRDASEELESSYQVCFKEYSVFRECMNNQTLLNAEYEFLNLEEYAYVKLIYQADLISRILNLSDVINNPGNWGALFSRDDRRTPLKLQIIDFLVKEERINPWEDFQEGNGIYNYWNCHDPAVRRLVFEKRFRSRFEIYKPVFQLIKERWDPSTAFQKVLQFLEDKGLTAKLDMERGEAYFQRIQRNFDIFDQEFSRDSE